MADVLEPAVHRSIVLVDVEGFGARHRTRADQAAVRDGLYQALEQAFSRSRIDWDDCYREDRGDGVLILVPPQVPKTVLAAGVPGELAAAVRAHNQVHGPNAQMRLRLALHGGEVLRDPHGVTGAAVNLAFRLLEAGPLKQALASSPGVLAAVCSAWFYEEVIRHAEECAPATWRRVHITVKETSEDGWISLPDAPYPARKKSTEGDLWRKAAMWSGCLMTAVLAGVLISALIPQTQTSSTAVKPSGSALASPSYKFIANNGYSVLDITATGLSNPVIISNQGTDNNWAFVNRQSWKNLHGTTVHVSEIQHAGTSNCINYSQKLFEMSGCVSGDKNELFWADPTGLKTNGNPNYRYINVAASDAAHHYIFVAVHGLTNISILVGDDSGSDGLAMWSRKCSANC
jgi:hypothetical protein